MKKGIIGSKIIYERLYDKLIRVLPPEFITKKVEAGKSKVSGLMDLNYDYLREDKEGNPIIALSHYYKHPSGDMIADPDMEIRIFPDMGMAEAMTYQDSFGFRRVYHEDDTKIDLKAKKELNTFLNSWLSNLIRQGHKIKEWEGGEIKSLEHLSSKSNPRRDRGTVRVRSHTRGTPRRGR